MNKRPFVSLVSLLLVLMGLMPFASSSAQVQPTIRVYLRRLQVEDALHVTVKGNYMLEDGSMTFAEGAELTVVLRSGQLVLHSGQVAAAMGERMKLVRCETETPGALLLAGSTGLYEGDLLLSADEDVIRPILYIDIEDYLLGVVPFEMGDSFPLEALKAQAIAARTYALNKSGSSGDYDVEDTTNDQAYRGRTTTSPLSEQAVRETRSLCGVFNGKLAQCYYSASNGGQTELGQHVWPTSEPNAYSYMDMRDDPYDLENDASTVKRYTLSKKPGEIGVGAALHSALVAALAPQLEAMGVEADDALVRFDAIESLKATTPKYEGDSRLMTQMEFTVKISTRSYTFRDLSALEQSEKSTYTPTASSTPRPTPQPTATPAYAPYQAVSTALSVSLPIFPTAEKAMGLSINISQNELITIYDIGSDFIIESRRYGHGVGMSQRGAQQMAAAHGMTYDQILSFYYPGMGVVAYELERTPKPTADMELMATPQPTPSPTPRPTLMPVSAKSLPQGAYLAVVSSIDEDSTLNLREQPSLSAEVLRRLYKDQKLIVLETYSDGWAKVMTDVIEGYVRSEYLQAAEIQ